MVNKDGTSLDQACAGTISVPLLYLTSPQVENIQSKGIRLRTDALPGALELLESMVEIQ